VGQFDQAIRYYEQLLVMSREVGSQEEVADTLYNIGSTLERKGDLDRSLAMYQQALETEQRLGRSAEAAYVKRSIGIILSKLNRASEAIPLFSEALQALKQAGDIDREMSVRLSRGTAYNRIEKYDAAIADLEFVEAYYKRQNNPRFLEKTEEELAKAYAGAGRWPEAFRAKSSQMALSRVLAEKLREETSARLRIQFDMERKEQENLLLTRQNAANSRIRLLQTCLLVVALAVVAVVSALAFRLRTANASLRVAQERIARFNDTSAEALRDVGSWSRATAKELAAALDAKDIIVYIQVGHDLSPLTATEARPPTVAEVDAARKQPAQTNDGHYAMAAAGLSGRLFGALLITGKTGYWTDAEMQVLATFAHQLGAALELQQVRSDLSDARERSLATRRQMIERGIRMLAICRECRRCFPDDHAICPTDGSVLDASSTLPYDIAHRYEFRQLLGVGGMGEVFAARDLRLERDIAVKVIKPSRMDADSRLRFEREARAIARVQHDHVMAIFDSGELEDGSAFLVTELLHGADLAHVIRVHGRGTIAQVSELVRQGISALSAVHAAGIIHRDIKPSNLFLIDTKDGFHVKLVDFGIAKALDSDSHLTHSGAIIGTPAYMAPEQITAGTSDMRTDLYSFAAVIYEALTAVRVHRSDDSFAVLWDTMSTPIDPPSRHRLSLSTEIDRVVVQALAKRPSDRPDPRNWATEMVHALRRVRDNEYGWPHPLAARAFHAATGEMMAIDEGRSTIESPPPA
jgi:eukaryotic-like serine/threonine-protein kinase